MADIIFTTTQIKYTVDKTLLKKISKFDDIDEMFFNHFQIGRGNSATRLISILHSDATEVEVPVVFYNENDRIKSQKESPIIIIAPVSAGDADDSNYVGGWEQVEYDNNGHTDYKINQKPVYHTFQYRVTCMVDDWRIFRRLSKFIADQIFPEKYGQRVIIVSEGKLAPGVVNRRYIEIVDESKSEDFENNHFQSDVTFQFDIPLHILNWDTAYGIEEVTVNNTITE